ncbi:MAG: phage terminase large subunit, partial [Oscillibacter sp.]|nr:phage terminase large subunit [Oscillibacter sp.]
HLDFIGTLAAIREARKRFPAARAVLIEDKANGSAILSVLQREMFCVPVEPRGGKVSRVHAVSPAVESGHVFLPQYAPWREAFLDQWCAFPAASHDDMVDASTQALLYLFHIQTGETVRYAESAEGTVLAGAGLYEVY